MITSSREDILRRLGEERPIFVAFVAKRAPADVDPEDVVQRALTRAVTRLDSLRSPERTIPWFYTLLRHELSDVLRSRTRQHANLSRLATLSTQEQACARDAPDGRLLEQSLCGCGVEIFEELPESWREVMWRVDVEGEKLGEVADELGISSANARVRAHRARARMREQLQERCGTDTLATCMACTC